jgi:hypothetical protein
MEPKSKKMSTREAVAFVELRFPAGSTLKRTTTGELYMMGAKASRDSFWLMSLSNPEKGEVSVWIIKGEFEKVAA